ncbi:MAG: hypothetical protein P8013_10245 [Candidatus Sulfobium sp.]|jgi:hypothetical protein
MRRFFSIGELKISLESNPEEYKIFLDAALESFAAGTFELPDIQFRLNTTSPFPSSESSRKIFTSGPDGLWTILKDDNKPGYLISLQAALREVKPYRMIKADREFTDFIIYARPNDEGILAPLEYPLGDLAVSGHININKIGIILHSACISLNGRGYLFAGVSGAGKSTMSEIWQQDGGADVLTDERVIIREFSNELSAFGTPWHGTAEMHKNIGVPIEKIFFIRHGKENRAIPISKTDAVNRLLVRCFPTFWNREGMEFSLDFCTLVAQEKECYELEFVNDSSVVNYVRSLVT